MSSQSSDGTLDTPPEAPRHDARGSDDVHSIVEILFHPDLKRVGQLHLLADGETRIGRLAPDFAPLDPAGLGGSGTPLADPYVSREQLTVTWLPSERLFRVSPNPDARLTTSLRLGPTGPLVTLDAPRRVPPDGLLVLGDRIVLRLGVTTPRASSPSSRGGARDPLAAISGNSTAADALRAAIRRVARFDGSVLVLGETGTGKELVANAIHALRAPQGPFVALNMGGLDPGTAGSELFGHVRGAFTDAHKDRDGAFASARGGTLFLDEIGDLAPDLQKKLLRVLESRKYAPVGSHKLHDVDCGVVSATHVPLTEDVASGAFRRDLYERLGVLSLQVPPLRTRWTDIPSLFCHFLGEQVAQHPELGWLLAGPDARGLPPVPLAYFWRLMAETWPGNVRSLRNVAIATAAANVDRTDFVAPETLATRPTATEAMSPSAVGSTNATGDAPLRVPTADELLQHFRDARGNVRQVAATLGASRYQVYRWLASRGLAIEDLRRPDADA